MNDTNRIPWFATIVTLVCVLIGLSISYGQLTHPASLIPGAADVVNPGLQSLALSFGGRSIAMAIGLLIAWILKSPRGLIALLSMRAITESFDFVVAVNMPNQGLAGLIIFFAILIGCELGAVAQLYSGIRKLPLTQ